MGLLGDKESMCLRADPDFFKGGGQSRTDRTFSPVETGCLIGMCPIRSGVNVIFKVNSHDLVHSFCLRHPHEVWRPISAKIEGRVLPALPLALQKM